MQLPSMGLPGTVRCLHLEEFLREPRTSHLTRTQCSDKSAPGPLIRREPGRTGRYHGVRPSWSSLSIAVESSHHRGGG